MVMKCSARLMLAVHALTVVLFGLEKSICASNFFYAGYLHPRTNVFKVLLQLQFIQYYNIVQVE